MKRALLIAGGTVGGLGAVLSITPPQLGAHSALGGGLLSVAGAATTTTPIASTTTNQPPSTPAATAPVAISTTKTATTPKVVVKKKHKTTKRKVAAGSTATKSKTPTATTPVANTPTPAKSTPPTSTSTLTPVVKKTSGTYVGNSVFVNFGNVQVQITVSNGRITDAQALQAPQGGRSGSISSQAIPMLRQQTLSAQSSAIQGVGGASYTSYGWYTSLQSALTKAGLPLQ